MSIEPVSCGGIEPADVDKFDVAFCDSAAGLHALDIAGLRANARIRTSAPYLLFHHAARTEHLEAVVSPQTAERFKASIRPFVERVYDTAVSYDSSRAYARTLARATAFFHRTVYKALCLDEDDFVEPRLVVQVQTGDVAADRIVNPPWPELLGKNENLQILPVTIQLERREGAHEIDRLRRWLFRGPGYLGFRIGQSLSRHAPRLFRRDRVVFVLKENELVHETAFRLALNQIPLERLPRLRPGNMHPAGAALIDEDAWSDIADQYRDHLGAFLCASARDRCVRMALDDLQSNANRQQAATEIYSERLADERRRAIVLTNYPGSPEEYGLFAAGDRLGIPTIAFQHGISRELNEVHGDLGVENSAAHLTALYNDAGKRQTDATQFYHGRSIAVGFPNKGRRLERLPRWCFKKSEPILYVSTNLYRGTVNTVSGSFSDIDSCRAETAMVDEVLAVLPHRVSYKPYPDSLRYPDADPVLEHAHECNNISVIEESVDVRYFLRSADLIISSRATSTTGWCILSGQPFCFVDVPQQMPLAAEVRSAFEDAFFYFTMAAPDFHDRLRSFLSQPLEQIRDQWNAKQSARQSFKDAFIDKPTHSASAVLAECLANEAFDPAFCRDNSMVPPDRYRNAAPSRQHAAKKLA